MKQEKPVTEEKAEVVVGEVITDSEASEIRKRINQQERLAYTPGSMVTKSNELIQKTKYTLPRTQQKILFVLMSKIDQKHDTDPAKVYEISFNEFSKLTGVQTMDTHYLGYLQDTIKDLAGRGFWIKTEDGYKFVRWLGGDPEVNTKRKVIRLQFGTTIWPEITQLTSNYTSYSIEYLLMMKSTYSMRIYEILLSYDNGNRNYGYTNGLVFEPVTEEVLKKFSAKRDELRGFKFKRFDMDEFKALLSVPRDDEKEKASRSKKKEDARYNREKPLAEKYKTYGEFEKNVLRTVKTEINEMTDLWFDYVPARERGERRFKYLYIFIKYKNKDEMKDIRAYHDSVKTDTEVIKETGTRKRKANTAGKQNKPNKEAALPFPADVYDIKYRKLTTMIKNKADYASYEDELTDDEKNILNDVFTYTSKILTNDKRHDEAEEMVECLNRIIADNAGLKTWALGMCVKFETLFQQPEGRSRSAQYYRTVVFNETTENSAIVIANGKQKLATMETGNEFKVDMTVFDEN